MSRRTAEASKVIAAAWNNEKQLVLEGKGTRDWKPDQQQEILDKGKAYDDNGRAFEGHHMKSVEKYPECQGEQGNIQFLNRQEHQEAHGGNYRNPTNGYFNPCTGETIDFGINKYEPCEIIYLSEPVVNIDSKVLDSIETNDQEVANEKCNNDKDVGEEKTGSALKNDASNNTSKSMMPMQTRKISSGGVKHFLGQAAAFYTRHKNVIDPLALLALLAATAAYDGTKAVLENSSNSSPGSDSSIVDGEDENFDSLENSEDIKRSSPREHLVSGYDRQQNGNTVHVNPYLRGKNKDD